MRRAKWDHFLWLGKWHSKRRPQVQSIHDCCWSNVWIGWIVFLNVLRLRGVHQVKFRTKFRNTRFYQLKSNSINNITVRSSPFLTDLMTSRYHRYQCYWLVIKSDKIRANYGKVPSEIGSNFRWLFSMIVGCSFFI